MKASARVPCLAGLLATLPAVARDPPRPRPVVAVIEGVARSLRTGRYRHDTVVDVAHGRYEWDCSGMAAWVLRRGAPRAEREVEAEQHTPRPLARDYHDFVERLPDRTPRGSWQRVTRVRDARPGDVIAWVFPPTIRVAITGHVAFVVDVPRALPGRAGVWRVRIADSTSVPHADDTRDATGRSGFGEGDLELTTDARGAATGYRWNLRPGRGTLRTSIVIARPLR